MRHVITFKGLYLADEIEEFILYLVSRLRLRELLAYLRWAPSILSHQYIRLIALVARVDDVAYRFNLHGSRCIDDEFHVSLLSCYMARKDFYPSRWIVCGALAYEVEGVFTVLGAVKKSMPAFYRIHESPSPLCWYNSLMNTWLFYVHPIQKGDLVLWLSCYCDYGVTVFAFISPFLECITQQPKV